MFRHSFIALLLTLGIALSASAAEVVVSDVTSRAVPIHVTGFSGDAKTVLEFDLYVAGFDLVALAQAQYSVNGKSGAALEGVLADVNNNATLFNRSYPGGSPRAQAHALADDVVQAITGRKGISRTKMVFKVQKDRISEVYASDFDGANPVQLTADGNIVAAPAWRPGRKSLVYTSYRAGNADIYSQDLTTGSRKALVRFSGSNISPAPSPDGSKLAMILSKAGSPDLWVSDAEGGNPRRLTTTAADESSPCWSPDGSSLCVVSRESGFPQLYIVSASGALCAVSPPRESAIPPNPIGPRTASGSHSPVPGAITSIFASFQQPAATPRSLPKARILPGLPIPGPWFLCVGPVSLARANCRCLTGRRVTSKIPRK